MDIGATIARIIQAVTRALASMTRATKRWCAKSSTWVYDRVVEPAVDYTGEACSGALAGVMGFMPDVIDATARLPGQAIRGTGAVLEGGGRLIGNTFTAAASVPGKVVSTLLGGGGAAIPHPAPQNAAPRSDVADAVSALQARRQSSDVLAASRQVLDASSLMRHQTKAMGAVVHAYAQAGRDARYGIDLDTLPEHVRDWLLTRSEDDLQRLADAGPAKCGLATMGKRSGIVGLELPGEPWSAPGYAEQLGYRPEVGASIAAQMGVRDVLAARNALGGRIARARGVAMEMDDGYGMRPAH